MMPDYMFYPELTRRQEYEKKADDLYYSYEHYYDVIEEDCKSRCVYCDAIKEELGGDKMELDHFRPQNIFDTLKNDPNNLVLSCNKCNRLKWDHWPVGCDLTKTHNGIEGFIDPFQSNLNDYFEINNIGEIASKKPPASYVINLLKLDRPTRTQLRRRRVIQNEIDTINEIVSIKLKELTTMIEENKMQKAIKLLDKIQDILCQMRKLN